MNYRKIIACIEPLEVEIKASEVIQKFLTVSREPYLIMYLETLHEFYCSNGHHEFNGKAYTQLLFDCYIKTGQFEKVRDLFANKDIDFLDSFLDIDRSINILRESPKTVKYAILLTRNAQKWVELVKIYFERRKVSEICDLINDKYQFGTDFEECETRLQD